MKSVFLYIFCSYEVLTGFANLLNLEKSHVDLTTHHVGYNVNRERDFMASVHHCRLRFHSYTDAEAIQNRLCNHTSIRSYMCFSE